LSTLKKHIFVVSNVPRDDSIPDAGSSLFRINHFLDQDSVLNSLESTHQHVAAET